MNFAGWKSDQLESVKDLTSINCTFSDLSAWILVYVMLLQAGSTQFLVLLLLCAMVVYSQWVEFWVSKLQNVNGPQVTDSKTCILGCIWRYKLHRFGRNCKTIWLKPWSYEGIGNMLVDTKEWINSIRMYSQSNLSNIPMLATTGLAFWFSLLAGHWPIPFAWTPSHPSPTSVLLSMTIEFY